MSNFEKLSDKILNLILLQILKQYDDEGIEYMRDDMTSELIDPIGVAVKPFGIPFDRFNDGDFLWNLFKMNVRNLDYENKNLKLERPVLKEYSYEIDVHEMVYQRLTYRHTLETYSKKPSFKADYLMDEGDLEWYDGDEIDRDVYDSETNEIKIDRGSFEEIKSKKL